MHIADFDVGMLGANGAVNRGPFLEGLNWAVLHTLPVLFVCDDNGFAATTRTAEMTAGPGIAARAESLGVAARAENEPVARCRTLLNDMGIAETDIAAAEAEARVEMSDAVATGVAAPWPDAALAFTDVQDIGAA